jgi:hypothetical protein
MPQQLSGQIVRALAWGVGLYGLATFVLGVEALYMAATSQAPEPSARLLGVWLAAHLTLFTLLKVTLGVAVVDEHFRLMQVTDTVAGRIGGTYRVAVALTYLAMLAVLVGVYCFQPRVDSATGRPALLFLTGGLSGLSLLFIACAVVGPRAVLERPSDRPPLLYRLRRRFQRF